MKRSSNPRVVASQVLHKITSAGVSLAKLLPSLWQDNAFEPAQRALVQELCYGTCRWYFQLEYLATQLLSKPLRSKDHDVYCLILIGLYQLQHMQIKPYAVVNETAKAAKLLGKSWAVSLVNAVLRNYQRQQDALSQSLKNNNSAKMAHPQWLCELIQKAWPQHVDAIMQANNQRPPLVLRVNRRVCSREDYLQRLHESEIEAVAIEQAQDAILLKKACSVSEIPGFYEGVCSVQDAAAQLAADLLDLQVGQRVLDACAAPGGKTTHILERQSNLACLHALDNDAQRLEKIHENLQRLALHDDAKVKCLAADAADITAWWDGELYDRILLDAPCSATGVIRRHPDIKLLRQADDIAGLAMQQQRLLSALWRVLKPGGKLVYATCSVLPAENVDIVSVFLDTQKDAREMTIDADWGHVQKVGRQVLPGDEVAFDGFYYAVLGKNKKESKS